MARKALGLNRRQSRHMLHTPLSLGGLGIPIPSGEISLSHVGRALMLELERPGVAGDLSRALWDHCLDCDSLPEPPPLMVVHTRRLAEHGFLVMDARRMPSMRVLSVLSRKAKRGLSSAAPWPASLTSSAAHLASSQAYFGQLCL